MAKNHLQASDVRGIIKLIFNAIDVVTNIVEGMHHTISKAPSIVGAPEIGPTSGLTGLVYRLIRTINGSIGTGIDVLLKQFIAQQELLHSSFEREAALAALNGVLGDFLENTHNPLALNMCFRAQGKLINTTAEEIKSAYPYANGKIMIFLHGLCMNDLYWAKLGGQQPELLAAELGFTPVYLRYNTGRHISLNGREFASQLEKLVVNWPVKPEQVVFVGHSMGGLVARSACYYAERNAYSWRQIVKRLYCLGTPHHGSHLERGGNFIQYVAGISPYTFPLSRLGAMRSAGITDLRYGNLLDEDWVGVDRFHHGGDRRTPLPLPAGVESYAIAATLSGAPKVAAIGDGLVRVRSAFGEHDDERFELDFPASNRFHVSGISHFDLMSQASVYAFIRNSINGV